MFFDGATGPLRVVIVGVPAYIIMVLALRATGKRTLSKLNAFDFIVTVALGSTLATILLSKDVSLVEGVTAFLLLIVLQYAVTWMSVRSSRFRSWVKAEPRLVFHDGDFLAQAMVAERLTRDELLAAMREQGHSDPTTVLSVVLETDGSLSVCKRRG